MVSGGRCPPHGDWIACLWTPRTPSPITIGGLVDGARPGVGGRRGRRVGRLYRVVTYVLPTCAGWPAAPKTIVLASSAAAARVRVGLDSAAATRKVTMGPRRLKNTLFRSQRTKARSNGFFKSGFGSILAKVACDADRRYISSGGTRICPAAPLRRRRPGRPLSSLLLHSAFQRGRVGKPPLHSNY